MLQIAYGWAVWGLVWGHPSLDGVGPATRNTEPHVVILITITYIDILIIINIYIYIYIKIILKYIKIL